MKKKMSKKQEDQVVTMGLLLEFTEDILIPRLSEVVDEKMDKRFDAFEVKMDKKFDEFDIKIDGKLKKMKAEIEHSLKAYVDRKSTETIEEIFRRLEKKYGNDHAFREKVVEVLKKNKIGTENDFAYFEGILAGG
jgi:poly-D-alanine transfer protein DltD